MEIDQATCLICGHEMEPVRLGKHQCNYCEDREASADDVAKRLAAFLWECSALRHGLFNPPEFRRIAEERIREFFRQNDRCGGTGETSSDSTKDVIAGCLA